MYISLFPRQKTIVKKIFFKVPIMGWIMKAAGYLPLMRGGEFDIATIKSIKAIPEFIQGGGNIFIFPEGSRSRDKRLGKFQKGAFTISARQKIPIEVLFIKNTDSLFAPGKFLLNTCIKNTITVERLATIDPNGKTANEMREMAVRIYEEKMKENASRDILQG